MKEPTIKDLRRMCKFQNDCKDCPLYSPCSDYGSMEDVTDEQIADVAKWVEENPPKTRLDKLREIFPDARAMICPRQVKTFSYPCPERNGKRLSCDECRAEYWNAEAE